MVKLWKASSVNCNSLLSAHARICEREFGERGAESGASYCMAQASYIDLTSARVATIVRWRCLSQSASPFAARLGPRDFPASILQALHICAVFCAMAPRRAKTTRTQTHANHLILSLCASITDTWSPINFPLHMREKFFTLSVFRFSIELRSYWRKRMPLFGTQKTRFTFNVWAFLMFGIITTVQY